MKQGWEIKKLGEVCYFQNGFAFKSNTFTDRGEPILRISDIQNDEIIESKMVFFNPKSYPEDLSRFLVYPNDIVIAMSGGTTGKIGINKTNKTFYLNQRVGVFRENPNLLNHQYLYYFLKTKSEESLNLAAGAAQPNLSTVQINAFEIPTPSLAEQERIVGILDKEFERIDALKANAEQNLQHAKDLFQSALKQELQPKEGWETMKLGEFAHMKAGDFVKASDIKEEYFEGSFPCYGGNGLRGFVTEPNREGEFCLIGRQGALCGNIHIAKGVFRATEHAVVVSPYFQLPIKLVYYLLVSLNLNRYSTGAAQPGLSVKNIAENVVISVPSKNLWDDIANKLCIIEGNCKALEENYSKTIALCDDMKQALLRKAFNGEL